MFELENLIKTYELQNQMIVALKGITVKIPANKITCFLGHSGSGKSTLLKLLSGKITSTTGLLKYNNYYFNRMLIKDIRKKKKNIIQFIGQYPEQNLFLNLSVEDNFKIILNDNKIKRKLWNTVIDNALNDVNLPNINLKQKASTLSGGEQQRLAIALAIIIKCKIIIADEPTGNVDKENAIKIINTFQKLKIEKGLTIIIGTHDYEIQNFSDKTYIINDGRISFNLKQGQLIQDVLKNDTLLIDITSEGTITLPKHFLDSLPKKDQIKITLKNRKVILDFNNN